MSKEIISTPNAPAAIGPYSQAVKAGGFLYLSGQIPLDPQTMAVVPGCVACQTEQALKNMSAVLESQGLTTDDVVKTTVFIKDMNDSRRSTRFTLSTSRRTLPRAHASKWRVCRKTFWWR